MNIYKNLKEIRLRKNYTQEFMANQLGISQAAYGKIENGATEISAERLVKLTEILDVNIAELISKDSIKYINNKEHNGDVSLIINKNALELHKQLLDSKDKIISAKDALIKSLEAQIATLKNAKQ